MDNQKRILLIDDEEVITFGFSRVLQDTNVIADAVQTLAEAERHINTYQYDAAVVDLRLSNSIKLEGLECVQLLHKTQSDCKIIVLTAYSDNGMRSNTMALGAHYFFEKPVEPEKIKGILKSFGIYG